MLVPILKYVFLFFVYRCMFCFLVSNDYYVNVCFYLFWEWNKWNEYYRYSIKKYHTWWKALNSITVVFKGPSHIKDGARPTSLRAKNRIFTRMTAGVCSITAGSAVIFRDRPAFAGHRNLFLIQRFSNGRISDLRNMTCTNFKYMSYLCEERPERHPGVGRASTDLLSTDRNAEGARPYIERASQDSC